MAASVVHGIVPAAVASSIILPRRRALEQKPGLAETVTPPRRGVAKAGERFHPRRAVARTGGGLEEFFSEHRFSFREL
jgi:hypothetical protein